MSARTFILLVTISSLIAFTACTKPISQFYNGRLVESSAVLVEKTGVWETYDVSIKFVSVKSEDTLSFSGHVELTPNYQLVYNQLRFFNVYLFFVNDQKIVLKTVPLLNSVADSTEITMSFDVSSEVPQGTTAIALGYSGSVYERDNYSSFSMLPSQAASF
jgi:hypothetical protein